MPRTSTKQGEILEFLRQFASENGYAPSVREICAAVGLKSTASVHYHLGELKRRGLIDMDENKNRTISLSQFLPPKNQQRIPIIGVVTAGLPILAVENVEGYLPGDKVVVRPQNTAVNGEIVVALLEDEATVKRFHRSADGVWLLPENPAYEPIDGRHASILGKVKAVIREY